MAQASAAASREWPSNAIAIASMRRDALAFFDRAASARSSVDVRSVRVIDNATIPHPMSRLSKHRLMTGWIRGSAYESHPGAAGISVSSAVRASGVVRKTRAVNPAWKRGLRRPEMFPDRRVQSRDRLAFLVPCTIDRIAGRAKRIEQCALKKQMDV